MTDSARPWLSVIVPTHDGERWLAETLGSIAAENDRGIECLVIDSSPSDGTVQLVGSFADRLSLRVLKRPDLDNWRLKTNQGFAEARADHVSMLHQDDIWLPGRAAAARRWVAEGRDAVLHLHPAQLIDEAGRRLGTLRCPLPAGPVPRDLLLDRLLVQNFVAVPTPVIRRDAFLAVGGVEPSLWYTGDWDLYLKLAGAGDTVYHPEPLAAFRIHGASMTMSGSRDAADFRDQLTTVLDRHGGRLSRAGRRAARASVEMNVAMAGAQAGVLRGLARAGWAMARLGPAGLAAFLRDSRLVERIVPRLRARAAGRL